MASTQSEVAIGEQVRVNCRTKKSALPYEVGVVIQGVDQSYESLMDSDLVAVQEEGAGDVSVGTVNANVIQVNGSTLLVELPRQVIAGGRRIWIPKSEAK